MSIPPLQKRYGDVDNHLDLEEEIRLRATELYEERCGEEGRALDNWLQAKAEVTFKVTERRAA